MSDGVLMGIAVEQYSMGDLDPVWWKERPPEGVLRAYVERAAHRLVEEPVSINDVLGELAHYLPFYDDDEEGPVPLDCWALRREEDQGGPTNEEVASLLLGLAETMGWRPNGPCPGCGKPLSEDGSIRYSCDNCGFFEEFTETL